MPTIDKADRSWSEEVRKAAEAAKQAKEVTRRAALSPQAKVLEDRAVQAVDTLRIRTAETARWQKAFNETIANRTPLQKAGATMENLYQDGMAGLRQAGSSIASGLRETGRFLNSPTGKIAAEGTGAALGTAGALIAGSAIAGYAGGKALDEKYGISDTNSEFYGKMISDAQARPTNLPTDQNLAAALKASPNPSSQQVLSGLQEDGTLPKFSKGGATNGAQLAVVGEGGEREYIIPESKMKDALKRYSEGLRGDAVIPNGRNQNDKVGGVKAFEKGGSVGSSYDIGNGMEFSKDPNIAAMQADALANLRSGNGPNIQPQSRLATPLSEKGLGGFLGDVFAGAKGIVKPVVDASKRITEEAVLSQRDMSIAKSRGTFDVESGAKTVWSGKSAGAASFKENADKKDKMVEKIATSPKTIQSNREIAVNSEHPKVIEKDAKTLDTLYPDQFTLPFSQRIDSMVAKNGDNSWRTTLSNRAEMLESMGVDTSKMKYDPTNRDKSGKLAPIDDVTSAWTAHMDRLNSAGIGSIEARMKANEFRSADPALSPQKAMDAAITSLKQDQVTERYSKYSWFGQVTPDAPIKKGDSSSETRSQREYRVLNEAMADSAIGLDALKYTTSDGRIKAGELSDKIAQVNVGRIIDKYDMDMDVKATVKSQRENAETIQKFTFEELQSKKERRLMLDALNGADNKEGAVALDAYMSARDRLEKLSSTSSPAVRANEKKIVEATWASLAKHGLKDRKGKDVSLQTLALQILGDSYQNKN